jgi:hypothetical protein
VTLCAFCGKNSATVHTTESDFVCRDCAIGFELAMQFGEDYELYESGNANPELVAQIEAEKRDWEQHFDKQANLPEAKLLRVIIGEGESLASAIVSPDADEETFDIIELLVKKARELRANGDDAQD